MSAPTRFLGSRRSGVAAAMTTLALAVSCGLSPVPVLPSATDGEDGSLDLDGPAHGTGGASAGSGGAPPCTLTASYECRGHELWSVGRAAGCTLGQTLLEACSHGCVTLPDDMATCADGGAAGADAGGAAGAGGVAGAGNDG